MLWFLLRYPVSKPSYGLDEFVPGFRLLVLHRVADVHLRVVAEREVDARHPLVVVLRVAAAGIDRQRLLDAREHRQVGGQRLECARCRWR